MITFEWDDCKARTNQRKHRVSFKEAATAFDDDTALVICDPDHPHEDRFVLLGLSQRMNLLVVCHTWRNDDVIRLISARRASPGEGNQYFSQRQPTGVMDMRSEYDFSKARPSPYSKRERKQITIRLEAATIEYFRAMADEMGMPYQSLINLYLRDCAEKQRKLALHWQDDDSTPENQS